MPMGKKYNKSFDLDIKNLTEKARGTKKTKVKGKRSQPSSGMLEGGGGGVRRAPMRSEPMSEEKGEIKYYKSKGPAKENIIDARAGTREAGKEALESERLRQAIKRRKRMKKMMEGLKKKY